MCKDKTQDTRHKMSEINISEINNEIKILPKNFPSLCIPRITSNVDEDYIRRVFDKLDMGEIHRVDIMSKTNDKGEIINNRVFIHFKRWFSSPNGINARNRLLNGNEIKVIYEGPWFWKISAFREKKH